MASSQKLRTFYILNYLREFTDENHTLSTKQIISKLQDDGFSCDRKTLYSEINTLSEFGYDIEQIPSRSGGGYKLISREFENAELKLLVDAVSSSRFITEKKSKSIISKLETLCSNYDAAGLQRQVYVTNRVKADNESILYQIDTIHRAMQEDLKISFHYYVWNLNKELVDKDGSERLVSPFALIWEDENYYLLAKDSKDSTFKNFRVDKMQQVKLVESNYREGNDEFTKMNIGEYSNEIFGMFGGETESVKLICPNHLVGVFIDRFGRQISLRKVDENHFSIRVKIALSNQFFGWITGLGGEVQIAEPENIKLKYKEYLQKIIELQD